MNINWETGRFNQRIVALKGDILKQQVKQEEEKAYQLGIDTIPHFIVNGQYEAVGAQSAEYFLNLLNQAYESK